MYSSRSIGRLRWSPYQASIFACRSSRFFRSSRLRGARSWRMASSALHRRSGSIPVPGSASFSMNSRSSAATCNAPIWFHSLKTPSSCKSFILAASGHAYGKAARVCAPHQRQSQKYARHGCCSVNSCLGACYCGQCPELPRRTFAPITLWRTEDHAACHIISDCLAHPHIRLSASRRPAHHWPV